MSLPPVHLCRCLRPSPSFSFLGGRLGGPRRGSPAVELDPEAGGLVPLFCKDNKLKGQTPRSNSVEALTLAPSRVRPTLRGPTRSGSTTRRTRDTSGWSTERHYKTYEETPTKGSMREGGRSPRSDFDGDNDGANTTRTPHDPTSPFLPRPRGAVLGRNQVSFQNFPTPSS